MVADALLAGGGATTLAPFTTPADALPANMIKDTETAVAGVAAAVTAGFVAWSGTRRSRCASAPEVLARRREPEAQAAVIDALADPEDEVRRAVRAGSQPSETTVDAVAKLLATSTSWPLRVRAAEALGRLGRAAGGGPATKRAVDTLAKAARGDAYALVREAAVRALAPLDPTAAAPVLQALAASDPEPRLRAVAKELLAARAAGK
ncbi:MAG: HEAT repeat domain-containing protein [Polyangiaceae bacterium]